jgi:two-component sensor histidine kinase
VQSIVRLTRADSVEDYAAAVEGRIRALSQAHAVLSLSRWHGADLGKLVDEELAPHRSGHADRLNVSGPEVLLEPNVAQSFALALHELVTNAVKHGALSTPSGKLRLRWEVESGALVLHWEESDGPPVCPPTRSGFGTRIIDGSVGRQLDGKASFDGAVKACVARSRYHVIIECESDDPPRKRRSAYNSRRARAPVPWNAS